MEYGSEEGEEDILNRLSPFEDQAEEGEVDMLDDMYGEEGEFDMLEGYGEEGEEMMEQDQGDSDEKVVEVESEDGEQQERLGTFDVEEEDEHSEESGSDDDIDFEKEKIDKFALKPIMKTEQINKRLHEVKQSFYNRLESKKLIKKQGRIPFTEHMCVTHSDPIAMSEAAKALMINDDIKREVAFYNSSRENVKRAMKFCVQAKVPIERPDDFMAEMMKTDEHMRKVKANLLKQQKKIQTFEEKKGK